MDILYVPQVSIVLQRCYQALVSKMLSQVCWKLWSNNEVTSILFSYKELLKVLASMRICAEKLTWASENLFCASTYRNILDRIAKPALENAVIRLGDQVNYVKTSRHFNKVYSTMGPQNGSTFDEVIVTTPLGWLQKHKDIFDPPLPERLSQAIDAIGYGTLEKVFITFPRDFWHISNRKFSGFIQWLSPKYSPETHGQRWNQDAVDPSTLPGDCAHPTLLFYLYGDQSVKFGNELVALKTKEEQDEFLTTFFKPYYSRMPNYDEASSDCTPLSFYATNWVKDDLAGNGSYSNFQVGLEEGSLDIEIMREGLPARGVCKTIRFLDSCLLFSRHSSPPHALPLPYHLYSFKPSCLPK